MVWAVKASCIVMFGPTTDNGQVCACVHPCILIHIYYICTQMNMYHTYICTHIHTYVHTSVLVNICTQMNMYSDEYVLYIHIYKRAYIHVYIYTSVHKYVHMHAYIHTCVAMCDLILLLFTGHLCSILAQC